MAVISLTPEQLQEQARVYLSSKEQIEQAIQAVNKTNGEIAAQWKGQAFQAYLEQYNQLYVQVQKFEQLLESATNKMQKVLVCNIFEERQGNLTLILL